jgi:stage III sporulation protein AG
MNGDWRQWLTGLWQQDRRSVTRLLIVGVVGLALLVWGSQGGGPGTSYRPARASGALSAVTGVGNPLAQQEANLDETLASILAAVPHAGQVQVAVTLSRSAEESYAKSRVPLAELGPRIEGVVVVAKGAIQPQVRQEMTQAVETLLQVQPYQVLVLPNGGGE